MYTLKQDINNNRGSVIGWGYMGTLLSVQFFYKPKTALKNEVY